MSYFPVDKQAEVACEDTSSVEDSDFGYMPRGDSSAAIGIKNQNLQHLVCNPNNQKNVIVGSGSNKANYAASVLRNLDENTKG
jgi:hypothetical protein